MAVDRSRPLSPHSIQLLNEAIALFQAGQRGNVEALCRKAIELDPGNAKALHLLGVVILDSRGAEDALPHLEGAARLMRGDPFVLCDVARAYDLLGRYAKAQKVWTRAAALAPRNAMIPLLRGTTWERKERYDEAESEYRRALKLDRRLLPGWLRLGTVQFARKAFSAAEASYRQALAIDPRHGETLTNLGNALRELGRMDEAEQAYRDAVAADPRHLHAQFNLGVFLFDIDRPDEALPFLYAAMQIDPAFCPAHFNFACLLAGRGAIRDALRAFEHVLQVDPEHGGARFRMGLVLLSEGRVDEAVQCYRDYVARAPQSPEALISLGNALVQQQKLQEAEASFRTARAVDGGSMASMVNLIDCLFLQNRQAEADELVRGALAVATPPADRDLHVNLGGIHMKRARFGLARPHYEWLAQRSDDGNAVDSWRLKLVTGEYDARAWASFAQFSRRARSVEPGHRDDLPILPQDLSGKTVLLEGEQGIGDELFFLRFAPAIVARGGTVCFRATKKLVPLLRARASPLARVLDADDDMPTADHRLWINELPYALMPGAADRMSALPPPFALAPNPANLERIAHRLEQLGPPPYIGVTWRGGLGKNDLKKLKQGIVSLSKKVPLHELAAALSGTRGTFLALQRLPQPDEIERFAAILGTPLHDLCALNDDLEDMLALLALIDGYVGVSNTNMHLRAALGKGADVLVPCPPEWRWMGTGNESPWFPGFEVYREGSTGDWRPALASLACAVEKRFATRDGASSS